MTVSTVRKCIATAVSSRLRVEFCQFFKHFFARGPLGHSVAAEVFLVGQ